MNNEIMMVVCLLKELRNMERMENNFEIVKIYERILGVMMCVGLDNEYYSVEMLEDEINRVYVEYCNKEIKGIEKIMVVFRGIFNFICINEKD